MKSTMKEASTIVCSCFLTILSFMASASHSQAMKGAYYPSWRFSTFPPSSIESKYFTHVYYSFLGPNANTFTFEVDASTAQQLLTFTSTLHSKNPPLKALYSIAGGAADPELYARMASNSSSRRIFILSTIEIARKYNFDGMDLDWEFPRNAQEMNSFSLLLNEWRAEVQKEALATKRPSLLLSAAVYFSSSFWLSSDTRSYPIASINKNLDWINVMNYDYRGSWDTSATGAHAALFDPTSNITTSYGLWTWIRAGLSRSKLVMGLPLYGKTWTLSDARVNGVGAPAVAVGPSGDGGTGILLYNEVVDYVARNNATVRFDVGTVSAYAVDGTAWIGYDDVRTTEVKIRYAKALGIRGYFFWALSYDDTKWQISSTASQSWTR